MNTKTILNKRYQLLELIAPGGMGEVWKAFDKILNRNVAIKFTSPRFIESNPAAISIFQQEARVGASLLGHPNVVTILDYGKHSEQGQDVYYIVMEYVEGRTIEYFINRVKENLDEETYYNICLLIAWEVGKAIEYAHKQNILHRDIKPLNAFISKYGITKVGDFGLARFIDAVTRTHTVNNFKSPAYSAPEQWKGETHDTNTDIYQLGCTLYHLFTGKMIFEKNAIALMFAHLNEKPVAPMEYSRHMNEELSTIIIGMVTKNSDDRKPLWELNDILAKELQKSYELTIELDQENDSTIEKVCEITDFPTEIFKKTGKHSFDFPDFNEVLAEGIELVLNGVFSFQIHSQKDFDTEEQLQSNLR